MMSVSKDIRLRIGTRSMSRMVAASGYSRKPHRESWMSVDRVPIQTQRWENRRQYFRASGTVRS